VSDRADRHAASRSSRALVAWLLVAGMGLLLIALGNEAMHSWSARLDGWGSAISADGPDAGPATSERRAKVVPGAGAFDRTRIHGVFERRAHSDDECAPLGRVPIGVMISCHQTEAAPWRGRSQPVAGLAGHNVGGRRFD
jgi:hypothetical protein